VVRPSQSLAIIFSIVYSAPGSGEVDANPPEQGFIFFVSAIHLTREFGRLYLFLLKEQSSANGRHRIAGGLLIYLHNASCTREKLRLVKDLRKTG
jgi:hypothetical protein